MKINLCSTVLLVFLLNNKGTKANENARQSSYSSFGKIMSNTRPPRSLKIRDGVYAFPILHHDTVEKRRVLEKKSSSLSSPPSDATQMQQLGALYQGYGTHYVDLWVGKPFPQRQTVIVDTGSQITAFPCVDCNNCGESYHTDHYFDHTKSESFQKLSCNECMLGHCSSQQCTMGLSYQEGSSWQAYEAQDSVYAGGLHDQPVTEDMMDNENNENEASTFAEDSSTTLSGGELPVHASAFTFDLHFGCQNRITGLFRTQLADGIMGMSNDRAAFWSQMHANGMIYDKKFSLCFTRRPEASREGTEAGAMMLGGVERKLHETPMVYAKNSRSTGFYTVHLRSIYFRTDGGLDQWGPDDEVHKIDIDETMLNSGGVIVDSGTTDTYLTRNLMAPFTKKFEEITGFHYSNDKLDLTDDMIEKLPTIIIQLEGNEELNKQTMEELGEKDPEKVLGLSASIGDSNHKTDVLISIPPSHYIEYDEESKKYVSRVYVNERSGSVLGANTMQGHDVLFDIDNKVVGFAESSCEYTALTGSVFHGVNKNNNNDGGGNDLPTASSANNAYCTTDKCKAGTMALLLLVAVQAVWAWRCFRARKAATNEAIQIPEYDDDDILHDFDQDATADEFAAVNSEII